MGWIKNGEHGIIEIGWVIHPAMSGKWRNSQ